LVLVVVISSPPFSLVVLESELMFTKAGSEKRQLGYVLEAFPKLSETFILEEMLELERLGFKLVVFALSAPREEGAHEKVKLLQAPVIRPAKSDLAASFGGAVKMFWSARSSLVKVGPKKWVWGLLISSWLAREAQKHGVSHLHAHFAGDAAWIANLASKLFGTPYSFTAHAGGIFAWPCLLKKKIEDAKFVVSISQYNKSYLVEECQLSQEEAARIRVIHCGVDLGRFQFRRPPQNEVPQILCTGRLEEKKGQVYLLRALKILADRGRDFRCWIVGGGVLAERLGRVADELGIVEQVSFTGPVAQEQVSELLKQADLFVLPCVLAADGNLDGVPVSLMEAMAVGVPVISTRLSGIPELIEDEESGVLVAPKDIEALAVAIARVLDDADFAAKITQRGRQQVEQEFDIVQNTAALAELFGRL